MTSKRTHSQTQTHTDLHTHTYTLTYTLTRYYVCVCLLSAEPNSAPSAYHRYKRWTYLVHLSIINVKLYRERSIVPSIKYETRLISYAMLILWKYLTLCWSYLLSIYYLSMYLFIRAWIILFIDNGTGCIIYRVNVWLIIYHRHHERGHIYIYIYIYIYKNIQAI